MIQHLISKRTYQLSTLCIVLFGVSIGLTFMIPLEVLPQESTPKFLFVRIKAPHSRTPIQNESALTLPVEGVLRTLPGLKEFSTQTSATGASLSLTYQPSANMKLAEVLLREGLQKLSNLGHFEMKDLAISSFNPDAPAIVKLSITSSVNTFPTDYLKNEFNKRLISIPGISKVELQGIKPKTITYNVAPDLLAQLGMDIAKLGEVLKFEDWRTSLGSIKLAGNNSLSLSARQTTNTVDEVRNQTLKAGSHVHLASIAKETIDQDSSMVHNNGKDAIFAEIFAKEGADLFVLSHRLLDFIQSPDGPSMKGLQLQVVFNKVDQLNMAISNVLLALAQSIGITALVVFLFLRQLRTTIIIVSAIPLSLLLTITFMYAHGSSLNLLTLSGLILSIGLVVDNAIVVVERVLQLRSEKSKVGIETYAEAAAELAPALLMSTLTTIIIFLPAAFVEGGDSFTDIIKAFQIPIIASLSASYIVAIFVLPLICYIFLKKKEPSNQQARGRTLSFAWMRPKRFLVFFLAGTVVAINFWYISDIKDESPELPREPFSQLRVQFSSEVPPAIRLKWFSEIEAQLLAQRDDFGFEFILTDFSSVSSEGQFNAFVKTSLNMDLELAELDKKLKKFSSRLKKRPGQVAFVGSGASGAYLKAKKMSMRLEGLKMSELVTEQEGLMRAIKKVKGIKAVTTNDEEKGKKVLIFEPDNNALLALKIEKKDLAKAIRSLTRQYAVDNLENDGETVSAKIVVGNGDQKRDLASLNQAVLSLGKGRQASLEQLGRFVERPRASGFRRKKGKVKSRFHVHFDEDLSSSQTLQLKRKVRQMASSHPFATGYGLPKSNHLAQLAATEKKSEFIIYLSGFMIFLILASLFESLLLPFTILLTVPLSVFFGLTGLKVLGMELDVMARLSLMILVGIGVNNAIVLVDIVERLRKKGLPLLDAIQKGCETRIQSVIMSTSTTVLGVLPIALGNSKLLGLPFASLGICIMSGMLLSTIVSLGMLPVIMEFMVKVERQFRGSKSYRAASEY